MSTRGKAATWRLGDPAPTGLARYQTMWRLFRAEQTDPEPFYRFLAGEAVKDLDQRYGPIEGQRIADVGCGPGWYSEAFTNAGAKVMAVDGDLDELSGSDRRFRGLLGDAENLPVADQTFDGVFCSNLLEHTKTPEHVISEMARVLRPGGWGYLSWTNWYSPWGGHEMSPYHYLGPRFGPKLYEKRNGPPRKNRYGEGLFAVHIGPTLKLAENEPRLIVERVEPRYWPWAQPIVRVPLLREFITWNCVIRFRRR